MSWLLVAGLTVRQPTWPGQGCWQWAGGTLERPLELLCDSLDDGRMERSDGIVRPKIGTI